MPLHRYRWRLSFCSVVLILGWQTLIEFPVNQLIISILSYPFLGLWMSQRLITMMITFFMTPMDTSLFVSFVRAALCILSYRVWPAMMWLAPFLYPIEMGGRFQSPKVPFRAAHIWDAMRAASLEMMGLGEDNNIVPHFGWVFCFVIFSTQCHKLPIGGIKFYLV